MHHHYRDITDRIPARPKWYDENATPRYCAFGPDETANIYAREAALVEILCQSCRTPFLVCFSFSSMDAVYKRRPLADQIRDGSLHYGDPPNSGCCGSGASMNCEDVRVIEYWKQGRMCKWDRDKSLEIHLADAQHDFAKQSA